VVLATDNQAVYMGDGNTLKALNTENGEVTWQKALSGTIGDIAFRDGVLYIVIQSGVDDTKLVALNIKSQQIDWSLPFTSGGGLLLANKITVADHKIYTTNTQLAAINANDGTGLWQTKELSSTLEHPIVSGNRVYVRSELGMLYAFDKDSGSEIGSLNLQNNSATGYEIAELSPVITDDHLIIPIGSKWIVAIIP